MSSLLETVKFDGKTESSPLKSQQNCNQNLWDS